MLNRLNRRRFLRQQTAADHRATEVLLGPLSGTVQYRRYVRGLHAFRSAAEGGLEGTNWGDGFGEWRPALILGALERDLRDLDLMPAAVPALPDVSNEIAAVLGRLYVLEGSALGARLLRRQALALGYDDDFGARHLAQQASGRDNWQRFLEILEGMDAVDLDQLAQSARLTFAAAAEAFASAGDGDA